jgi:hypothetical protein
MKKITFLCLMSAFIGCKNSNSENYDYSEEVDSTATLISDSISAESLKPKFDSVKIKNLKSLFVSKKDEFESNTWVQPKAKPYYRNQNGVYCYFSEVDGTASTLRFVLQYHKDDWLFIKKMAFLIDGENFEYIPEEVKRDNDETGITEWIDVPVNYSNMNIIDAIADAKSVKIKLYGDNYVDYVTLSKKQINSIKNTKEYFQAKGGSY